MNSKELRRICSLTAALALTASLFSIYPQSEDSVYAAASKYEFEDAEFTGTVKADKDAAASGGSVAYMTEDGTITVTVDAEEDGMYDIIMAAEGVGGGKQQSLYVNGASSGSISIAEGTGKYTPFTAATVKLKKGKNEIKISKSWGWTKFDYLEVKPKVYETVSGNAVLSNPSATKETQSLMNYLASVYGKHTVSGQQEIYMYGPHDVETEFEYIKKTTGVYPAIRGFDYGNFCNSCFGGDDGSTERVIDWVKNRGGIATSSFHLNVPNDMKSYKQGDKVDWSKTTYNATDSDFMPSNAYKEGTKEYDYYREALKTLAAEFNKLEAEGIPMIWRPLHEAEGGGGETGSWFWWGKEGSAVYKKLWIYTYETLTKDFKCNNLIWEWNGYDYATSGDWYPGDEYVDIVGYDKYSCTKYLAENNWQPSVAHDDTAAGSTFWSLVNLTDKAKMVAMAECDCISTLANIEAEHANWLYFCPWYDGGSDDINFLSNPVFNDPADLKEMYTSEYCISLDELPKDLYTNGKAPAATAAPSKKPDATPSPTAKPSDKPSSEPSAVPSATPSKDGRYEFEDAVFTGTVKADKDAGASGGSVAYMTEDGSITVTVTAPADGMYDLIFAAEGVGSDKQQNISVNGVPAGDLSIAEGSGKYTPFKATTVKLKKGENTIKITKSWGWTKFDYIEIKAAEAVKADASKAVLSNKNASAAAKSLYSYICKEYGKSIISGQQESTWMGSPDYEMNYIKDASGKLPAMRGLDYMGDDFDGVNKRAKEWFEKGGIVTICWHCGSDFADNYDDCKADDLDWDKALTPGTAEYEALSKAMDKGAKALKELKDAGVPVIWRPFHEFDGGWFWWGKGGAENFKKLWTMMYDKYTNEWELDNLIWSLGFTASVPADWYPGDEYVDIVGADTYVESDGSLVGMYNKLTDLVGTGVPVILHENGTIPSPENLQSEGAFWSSFMTWHTEWITDSKWNTKESIKSVYTSDYVITLDELPKDLYKASAAAEPGTIKTGDVDCDGKVDITDLSLLSLYIIGDKKLSENGMKAADTDHDGSVEITDLATLKQFIAKVITTLD
ncbi:MAG: dockerin type I domain-containing protein [Oscillospiraceae bacterium]|nr:dockerin type I domain-containing protein [Oscillospiraceae bacterium]